MNSPLDNFERLAARARNEEQHVPPGIARKVMRQIAESETDSPHWPIALAAAGYAAVAGTAAFWSMSLYDMITHPLLQFFNTVAMATF